MTENEPKMPMTKDDTQATEPKMPITTTLAEVGRRRDSKYDTTKRSPAGR